MSIDPPPQNFDAEFENLGEPEVRRRFLLRQGLHATRWQPAQAWLEKKESERASRSEHLSSNRDVRETEILSIAKEANRLASEANSIAKEQAAAAWRAARYAMYAAIIATVAALAANKDEIFTLIFGHP